MTPGRAGLLAGLALVAVANGWILAEVAWNRSGEPEARVELTERELRLPWRPPDDDEDSGLSLMLQWQGPDQYSPAPASPGLDRDKLRALGFDVHVPPASAEAADFYDSVPEREAFAVLEMEGDAWRRILADKERELVRCRSRLGCPSGTTLGELETRFETLRHSESRLVAIDVGRDPAALRQRHSDRGRVLILPAVVRLNFTPAHEDEPAALDGYLRLRIDHVHVPLPLRPPFDAVYRDERRKSFRSGEDLMEREHGPRYRAVLALGERHEPWLVRAERMSSGPLASFEKP